MVVSILDFAAVVIVGRIITEHREVARELAKSQEKFAKSFRASPDAAMITRASDGLIVDVNDGFERMSGYSKSDVVGTTTLGQHMWVDPEDRARLIRTLEQQGHIRDYEFLATNSDGEILICEMGAETIVLDDEVHVISIIRDITDHRQLQREVLEVSDKERQRIAHDLHDSVAQDLVGMTLLIKALDDMLEDASPDARNELSHLNQMLHHAIVNTRSIAQGLSPVDLSRSNLEASLEQLAGSSSQLFDVRVDFCCSDSIQLDTESNALQLYRIAQEAVNNAIHHGECGKIEVVLSQNDTSTFLSVLDDGKGFPERQQQNAGMGLKIMKYRAQLLGGSLLVTSQPDRGTLVQCSVPAKGPGRIETTAAAESANDPA